VAVGSVDDRPDCVKRKLYDHVVIDDDPSMRMIMKMIQCKIYIVTGCCSMETMQMVDVGTRSAHDDGGDDVPY